MKSVCQESQWGPRQTIHDRNLGSGRNYERTAMGSLVDTLEKRYQGSGKKGFFGREGHVLLRTKGGGRFRFQILAPR